MRVLTLAIAFALIAGCGSATAGDADQAGACTRDPFANGPKLSDYPAAPAAVKRPAKPDIYSDPQSRMFRTRLREGAKEGPNFAGHYIVVSFGYGAGCEAVAIVDAENGHVFWPKTLGTLEVDLADPCLSNPDVEILRFQPNSRLIIAAGLINEDEKRLGISYFVWERERLKLVKFLPLSGK